MCSRSSAILALSFRWYAPRSRFSETVMFPNRRRFSGTIEIPRATISFVGRPLTTSPSSRTSPSEGFT